VKGRLIALDHWDGREAAALVIDGRLEDLLIDPKEGPRLGDIFVARVERSLKGQGGALVSWPGGTGFLRRAQGLKHGESRRVQVSGYAEMGKAPPVSDRLIFKSRYAIVTPNAPGLNISRQIREDARRDTLHVLAKTAMAEAPAGATWGLIIRSAAAEAPDHDILEDASAMIEACDTALSTPLTPGRLARGDGPRLSAWRDWDLPAQIDRDHGSFEAHGILDDLERLSMPDVSLGAHFMAIEPTRALIAVDVNTGGDLSQTAALKANLAAVKDLPRHLRLRGLGGQITIDFAPLAKRDRRQIEEKLRAALRTDPVETEIIGWTGLGHLELKRKRERPALL